MDKRRSSARRRITNEGIMAIVPSTKYSGQIDTSDLTAYPHGKAQNVTVAGDGTGTPLEQDWVNDLWGFLQALLDRAGITPSGDPDEVGASDYMDALESMFGGPSGPLAAVSNLQNGGTAFSDNLANGFSIRYLPEFSSWYLTIVTTLNAVIYQSTDDGGTWGTPKTISCSGGSCSQVATDGSVLRVVVNDTCYESSDGTVAALSSHSTLPTNYDVNLWGLVYDDNSSKWVVACTSGSGLYTAYVATGTTWTGSQRHVSDEANFMAYDGAGRILVASDAAAGSNYYSDNGGVDWTNTTTTTVAHSSGNWSEALGAFVAQEQIAGRTVWWSTDGINWTTTTVDSERLLFVDGFVLIYADTAGASVIGDGVPVYALTGVNAGLADGCQTQFCGEVGSIPAGVGTVDSACRAGKIIYVTGGDEEWVTAEWRPE